METIKKLELKVFVLVMLAFLCITSTFIGIGFAQDIDIYTKLLVQSDTIDGDSRFTDSSVQTHPITAHGNTHHSSLEKKFGSTSIHFDGNGDFLSIGGHPDFDFGLDDFTIDFWANFSSTAAKQVIFTKNTPGGSGSDSPIVLYTHNAVLQLYMSSPAGGFDIISGWKNFGTIAPNVWEHYALVRNGSIFYLFKNGVLQDTLNSSLSLLTNSEPVYIGNRDYSANQDYFSGYIEEFRISKGIARWTSDFTPPVYQPPNTTGTIFTSSVAQIGNSIEQVVSETNPVSISFDREEFSSPFYKLISSEETGLEITQSGIYEISYSTNYKSADLGSSARRNAKTFVYKNGDPINEKIQSSVSYGYARGDTDFSDAPFTSSNASFFVKLTAGDTIHLYIEAVGDWFNGEATILADESRLKINRIE